jgi:ribonuclease PH
MLDLDYEEDSRADVDMNIIMTGSGKFIEVQATAEHRPFDDTQLHGLIDLARQGIRDLIDIQKRVVHVR